MAVNGRGEFEVTVTSMHHQTEQRPEGTLVCMGGSNFEHLSTVLIKPKHLSWPTGSRKDQNHSRWRRNFRRVDLPVDVYQLYLGGERWSVLKIPLWQHLIPD